MFRSAQTGWRSRPCFVMPGHSPSKTGVNALMAGLPRALDRDEVFAASRARAVARGNRSGDLTALDLAKRFGRRKRLGLTVGRRNRGAARLAARKAAVDAVAVRMIGDDEDAAIGEGRRGENQGPGDRHSQAQTSPHIPAPARNARWALSLPLQALRVR